MVFNPKGLISLSENLMGVGLVHVVAYESSFHEG